MTKKSVLGRGLGALIDESKYESKVKPAVTPMNEIELVKIEANPNQPRTQFDSDSLNELADSIRQVGLIQPITVRKIDDNKFQIISGERRVRAAKIAGLKKLPAYVREANDDEILRFALIENIQREDLNALEIAISYQRLMQECNLKQEELGERVGKKRSTVTNYLRLLNLDEQVQIGVRDDLIGMGHARALTALGDKQTQIKAYHKVVTEGLSVRKTEDLVRDIQTPEAPKKKKFVQEIPETYVAFAHKLKSNLQTKVEFKRNNNGRGSITINFMSDKELDRLVEMFNKLEQ